jgi:hypothetical protein
MPLWNSEDEIKFFYESLKSFSTPEQLFYRLESGYFAYVPKTINTEGQTLQCRNTLIGKFTEKWCQQLFSPIANKFGLYAINGIVCEEIGLTNRSSGDLAFCVTKQIYQKAQDVKLIFEIKMSIVSNYTYRHPNLVSLVGDYKNHKGTPSLLRSDSMLKAIGKAVNVRVSGVSSSSIPLVVLGNSPITESYLHKVDFLKNSGVVQGFWSLNPRPTIDNYIKQSPGKGFVTFFNEDVLIERCSELLSNKMNYFSSMTTKEELGRLISIANTEKSYIAKAEKFLDYLNGKSGEKNNA